MSFTKVYRIIPVLLLTLCACNRGAKQAGFTRIEGAALGTFYMVNYPDSLGLPVREIVDSTLTASERLFSIYDSLSVISRFNRAESYIVDREFAILTALSQEVSRISNGAFDPTVGPLARLWGFGEQRDFVASDTVGFSRLLNLVGYSHLRVSGDTIFKTHPEVEVSYNGIAKGYAADRVAEALQRAGCRAALVEVGGEIALFGKSPRGEAWRLGIDSPEKGTLPGENLAMTIEVAEGGVATSGNYRKFVQSGGKEWGHTIDPRTGRPISNTLLSATVVAPNCAIADGLATAMMVLGVEGSQKLVKSLPEVECSLIYLANDSVKVWHSEGLIVRPANR